MTLKAFTDELAARLAMLAAPMIVVRALVALTVRADLTPQYCPSKGAKLRGRARGIVAHDRILTGRDDE